MAATPRAAAPLLAVELPHPRWLPCWAPERQQRSLPASSCCPLCRRHATAAGAAAHPTRRRSRRRRRHAAPLRRQTNRPQARPRPHRLMLAHACCPRHAAAPQVAPWAQAAAQGRPGCWMAALRGAHCSRRRQPALLQWQPALRPCEPPWPPQWTSSPCCPCGSLPASPAHRHRTDCSLACSRQRGAPLAWTAPGSAPPPPEAAAHWSAPLQLGCRCRPVQHLPAA